jgi:mycothiol synthase
MANKFSEGFLVRPSMIDGLKVIDFGVNSQNLTGATRLYERAGMHVARQYITYEKELRAGIELSTRAVPV